MSDELGSWSRRSPEGASFLPSDPPLSSLPILFREWETVASQLSELLRAKKLRDAIRRLPVVEFSKRTLCSAGEWQRALCVLSFLFQGYLWQDGKDGVPAKIPPTLAIPLVNVSKEFGIPPVGTFHAFIICNWHVKDKTKQLTLENLHANITLTGTEDESWFYMIFVVIEKEFSPALRAILAYMSTSSESKPSLLLPTMKIVEDSIKKIHAIQNRIPERCSYEAFSSIRLYFAGTKGSNAFPNGLTYEGVMSKEPFNFHGISAAQSPSIKAIDAFLGVQHSSNFLEVMNEYIPESNRRLLEHISHGRPPLRRTVMESCDRELVEQFNSTVQALVRLRSDHIIMVTRYIINQRTKGANPGLGTVGTGGTQFMKLLKSARDTTKDLLIPPPK